MATFRELPFSWNKDGFCPEAYVLLQAQSRFYGLAFLPFTGQQHILVFVLEAPNVPRSSPALLLQSARGCRCRLGTGPPAAPGDHVPA